MGEGDSRGGDQGGMTALLRAAALAAALVASGQAHAATVEHAYPTRPIRLVIPFGPGGPSDFLARTFAERLRSALPATVIVDARPGGNTAIGTDIAAKAAPDGHTLLVVTLSALVSVPHLQKVPYSVDGLVLINRFATTPLVLAANTTLPASSLQQLVAHAKANPGKLNYGSSGVGSTYHLAAELLQMRTGIRMNHVPYKGSAQTLTDLMGGSIQLAFDAPLAVMPHAAAGKLRTLGTTGRARMPQLGNVPTFMEQGIADYELELRWGVLAPTGIPRAIAMRLHAKSVKIAALPEVKEAFAKVGVEASTCASLRACAAELEAERNLVGNIIRTVGIAKQD